MNRNVIFYNLWYIPWNISWYICFLYLQTLLDIFNIVTAAVALASAVAAVTPTPKDDEWVAKAYKFIDMIALNVGLAKDKGE